MSGRRKRQRTSLHVEHPAYRGHIHTGRVLMAQAPVQRGENRAGVTFGCGNGVEQASWCGP